MNSDNITSKISSKFVVYLIPKSVVLVEGIYGSYVITSISNDLALNATL